MDARRAARLAAAALGLGLVLRVGYALRGAHSLPTGNDDYEPIALSVVHRHEFAVAPGKPTSEREPVYPLVIAGVYAVAGDRPSALVLFQCLLSTLTGFLVWRFARRAFGEEVGVASAALFAVYPQAVYYCAYFFRETVLCAAFAGLMLASLDWSAEAGDPAGDRGALWGGIAAAFFGLGNSAVLPACALSGLLIGVVAPPKVRVRRFLLYTAPLVLAFGAWTARNWSVQGRFVPGSTHGGDEFYRALVVPPEEQTGPRVMEILNAVPGYSEMARLPEAEKNSAMTKAAFRWIGAHPSTFLSRAVAGVFKYWKPWPYKMSTYGHSYAVLVAVSLLSDGWIVPLGFLGLWLFRARWREWPTIPASILAMTGVYGAIHAVIRYRLPLMLAMIPLACAVLLRRFSRDTAA